MAIRLPTSDILDDLCTRFILNVPSSEMESFSKLMFLIEQAHWFYEDFTREKDPTLKSLSLKEFTACIFNACPGLNGYSHMLNSIYAEFNAFKQTVPVMGAIVLDPAMEKVLLVKGWQPSSGWGFPRGKIAKDESDSACAVREVIEETGFDIKSRLIEKDCIEVHIKEQRSKLYIIMGVEESTHFAPLARKEISAFGWHLIAHLPATKEAASLLYQNADGQRHRFFHVWPFVKQLRAWIKRRRRQQAQAGGAVTPQQLQDSQAAVAKALAVGKGAQTLAKPTALAAPATQQSSAPVQPGQAWINFHFDRAAIMQPITASF